MAPDFVVGQMWAGRLGVRLGNCTTTAVGFLLRNSVALVDRFRDGEETCLVLGRASVGPAQVR